VGDGELSTGASRCCAAVRLHPLRQPCDFLGKTNAPRFPKRLPIRQSPAFGQTEHSVCPVALNTCVQCVKSGEHSKWGEVGPGDDYRFKWGRPSITPRSSYNSIDFTPRKRSFCLARRKLGGRGVRVLSHLGNEFRRRVGGRVLASGE
jgi:hypothetical protein